MKGSFLLITYIGSILFKQFSIDVVLPTVLIYFLSNMSDYAELAFMKDDKVRRLRCWAFVIFLMMLFSAIITYCIYTTDNVLIINCVQKCYGIFYLLCIAVWFIPMYDGVRGQFDKIRNSATVTEQQIQSQRAYSVMAEGSADTYATTETNKEM